MLTDCAGSRKDHKMAASLLILGRSRSKNLALPHRAHIFVFVCVTLEILRLCYEKGLKQLLQKMEKGGIGLMSKKVGKQGGSTNPASTSTSSTYVQGFTIGSKSD